MSPLYPYALSLERYLELLDREYGRLLALSRQALTLAVATCPGWNGEDLVRHTALVYLQKAETIRTGRKPHGDWVSAELRSMNAIELLEECHRRLIEQFDTRRPEDPAESWVPNDQTVGFWIRRLTHETSIHRYDMEDTLGHGAPVAEDLAVDGIDEVLDVMLARGPADEAASASVVLVESVGKIWSATLNCAEVLLRREKLNSPEARVTGEPSDVLLWLWGRAPLPAGSTDNEVVAELRRRLASAT